MFLAESISDFYLDLNDERFISRLCNISIKDIPQILFLVGSLAQPFRSIAHNGEINTLKGNCNWMKVHEQEMRKSII